VGVAVVEGAQALNRKRRIAQPRLSGKNGRFDKLIRIVYLKIKCVDGTKPLLYIEYLS
jgi:hypothetical protein